MALTPQELAGLEAAAALMQQRAQSGVNTPGGLMVGQAGQLSAAGSGMAGSLYDYAKTAPVLTLEGNKEFENLNFQPLPGQMYRLMVNGNEVGRGNTPDAVANLVSTANEFSKNGGAKIDVRLQSAEQAFIDGEVKAVFADTYVNGANNNGFLDIAIPAALAIIGAAYLGPLIMAQAAAPVGAGTAAGAAAAATTSAAVGTTAAVAAAAKATALGLAAGAGIGSTAGNLLVGQPLDESLIRGLTTAATAYGGAGLGPVIGGGSFGVGAGAAGANFAANIAQGNSFEDSLKSAVISGIAAGGANELFGGASKPNTNPPPTGTSPPPVPSTTNFGADIGGSTSGFEDAIQTVLGQRIGSTLTAGIGGIGGAGASNISLRDSGNDFDQRYETWRNSLTARQLGGRDVYNAFMDGYPEGYHLNSTGQLSDGNYNIYTNNVIPGSQESLDLAAFLRASNFTPGSTSALNYFGVPNYDAINAAINAQSGVTTSATDAGIGTTVATTTGGVGTLTPAQIAAAAAAAAAGSNTSTGTTVATTTGGTGNDTITSSTGNDTITGGTTVSTNTLTGGTRNDTITGGTTVSTTTGGTGNDTITGGTTVSTTTGGTGNDTIRRTTATALNNVNPGTTVKGETTRTRLVINPLTGQYVATEQLNPAGQTVRGTTDEKTRLYFPNSEWLNSVLEQLKTEPPGPTTKQKVLSGLSLLFGLAPIVGQLAGGGGGGGGVLDPGPGLPPGGTGGIGRIRNPATFDPFTYGQSSGEFEFFRNAPATTGTVTGIGGTGTTTGTTGTTTTGTTGTATTGTTTTGTPGPAATAAEVQAAYPGFTNIRQAADGRWFGEPIPGYIAPATPATGLRVTAGATFNPTVDDYRLFNPGFESIERNADGRYSGVRTVDVVGKPGMTLAQVQAQYGATHRNITQDASGNFFGTRDVTTRSAAAPTTLEQVRALNLGYDDYELDNGNFSGIRRVTTNTPRPATLAEVQAQFGSTYNNITQNPDGRFFGQRTVQTSGMPTLEQIRQQGSGRNAGYGYDDYEQDGTDFYGINTGPDIVVPGTRKTLEQIRGENPDYDDYGQNEGGDYFGIKYVTDGPPMAEGGEVDDDMLSHLVAYRKSGGHLGPGRVKGIGSGQDDKIPAWLSDGEYVWSAQDVADLGDGSTDEGVRRLDKMRQMVRQGAGRKDVKKIAKPQRGIENMLKMVRQNAKKSEKPQRGIKNMLKAVGGAV